MKVKGLILGLILAFSSSAFASSFYPRYLLDCQQHYPQGKYFHHSRYSHGLYLPAYQYPRFGFYGRHYHRFTSYHAGNGIGGLHGFYRCYNPEGLSVECFKQ